MLSARLLPCVIQYVCWLFMTQFSTTCILKRSTCGFLTYYSVRSAKMGVSVSHPLRRTTKAKYIQTLDGGSSEFEETEQFFSRNLHQEHNKRETSRGNKGFSKRNEAGCLQFKGTRGNSRCPFDSLDAIDSRRSVPFAVLPENDTQASTGSRNGDWLFLDDVEDDLEDESLAQKSEPKLKGENTPHPAAKQKRKDFASSKTRSDKVANLPDRNHRNSTRSRQCTENRSNKASKK